MTTKDMMKWMILILTSIWIQIEVIRVKGHWIAGGNVVFPFLVAMLMWWCPRIIKDFKGGLWNTKK
ncbi:hypothetical protein [Leptotrichia trevisanii]|uniref:hypothetical protein n=1 Tax=Leptotrichia trevisanii TaxID=109328 RepID=UPI0012EC4E7C|nr:hypothetical protein [Leptotrichia trevisanii]